MKLLFHRSTLLKISIGYIHVCLLCLTVAGTSFGYNLDSRVQKFTLKNGVRILVLERDISPTASFYIRHKVGAVDDGCSQTGMAHFLEHMRFKGTTSLGTNDYKKELEILKAIDHIIQLLDVENAKENSDAERIGKLEEELKKLTREQEQYVIANEIDRLYTENGAVHMNASTGYDLTTYHVSLPSNKMELWARIESDRLLNPVFRGFMSERKVIIEEREQTVESNPERKLMELFLATAFTVHPYRRPILGWKSDMPHLNKNYMKEFFNTYYVAENTVIAVVGNVVASAVVELIDRYFGGMPAKPLPCVRIADEPPQAGERRVKLVAEAEPRLIIGYQKPTMPSNDDYVFDVIDVILSGGRSSRLYKRLVKEKGIASEVETANGFPGARYSNLFTVFASPKAPYKNSDLESALYEEIEALKNTAVGPDEMDKAKNQIKADFVRRLSSNSGLAGMLSYFETLTGDYRYITKYLDRIEKVSPEEVRNVAATYLTSKNRTVALLQKD